MSCQASAHQNNELLAVQKLNAQLELNYAAIKELREANVDEDEDDLKKLHEANVVILQMISEIEKSIAGELAFDQEIVQKAKSLLGPQIAGKDVREVKQNLRLQLQEIDMFCGEKDDHSLELMKKRLKCESKYMVLIINAFEDFEMESKSAICRSLTPGCPENMNECKHTGLVGLGWDNHLCERKGHGTFAHGGCASKRFDTVSSWLVFVTGGMEKVKDIKKGSQAANISKVGAWLGKLNIGAAVLKEVREPMIEKVEETHEGLINSFGDQLGVTSERIEEVKHKMALYNTEYLKALKYVEELLNNLPKFEDALQKGFGDQKVVVWFIRDLARVIAAKSIAYQIVTEFGPTLAAYGALTLLPMLLAGVGFPVLAAAANLSWGIWDLGQSYKIVNCEWEGLLHREDMQKAMKELMANTKGKVENVNKKGYKWLSKIKKRKRKLVF